MILLLLIGLQDPPKQVPAHPKVDQERVDAAIDKGCKWLIAQQSIVSEPFKHKARTQAEVQQSYLELVVLTLAHSGLYPEDDPKMQELLQLMLKKEIETTYTAALQAMALQKINPSKYVLRIMQCAQFLVDNQADNGQWCYGEKTKVDDLKPPKEEPTVATEGQSKKKKAPTVPKIVITKRRKGPPSGDNSNSQYAALGLRACMDAGIQIDPEVLKRARDWWAKSQNPDGGWGYNELGKLDPNAANVDTGVSNNSYGSMTVGAVGAMCIYKHYAGEKFTNDPTVTKGVDWIGRNFSVNKNPNKTGFGFLYYLYGLERAGILFGSEKFGTHEWYPEGANMLLDSQRGDGAWITQDVFCLRGIPDTCFAVLFLRRGTPPLGPVKIETGPQKKK
jgi:hypothetical protein